MSLGADAVGDHLALRQLAERYGLAVDCADADLFAGQFTEDAVLTSPSGVFQGRDALRTIPGRLRERYARTFHAVLNQVPALSGNRASAQTYAIARHVFERPGTGWQCHEMTIRYQDQFRRTNGTWLIARRELIVDMTHTFAVDGPAPIRTRKDIEV